MTGDSETRPDERGQIVGRVIADVGGAFAAGLGYIGDRLGLFEALASKGPLSSSDLALALRLNERYVREWLKAMVSAGYVERESETGRYYMTPAQQDVLAREESPVFAAGAFEFALPSLGLTERIIECFRTGGGVAYADLGSEIPEAIDRMHRAWFEHQLDRTWLPAVPGLLERLSDGIRVLDVGCGMGRASISIARAYPRSSVTGIDSHAGSIASAQAAARKEGLTNVRFRSLGLDALENSERFDLILAVDCIHDMADPVGALRRIRALLSESGVLFWSEPTGSDDPMENRNPVGRMRATLSPYHCLTVSLAEGGAGLGTIIGEAGARRLAAEAGFDHFEKLSVESAMQQFFLVKN